MSAHNDPGPERPEPTLIADDVRLYGLRKLTMVGGDPYFDGEPVYGAVQSDLPDGAS